MAIKISKNRLDIDGKPLQNVLHQDLDHTTTPANPPAGNLRIYAKSDNLIYKLTPAGAESLVGGGTRVIYVPASAMESPATNGAADGTTDGTNLIYRTKDYDQTTKESADFHFRVPSDYGGGNLTWYATWTASAGTGGVVWGINILARADNTTIDAAKTEVSTITDTLIATGQEHQASAVQSATLPSANNTLYVRISRNVADASDTLTADAKLIAIAVEF